ncbi:chorion peroxidase-like isoform X2 [Watersipora subatra]|uniref:chorion peroxidase-like isoform X2 n=1 Tax=Watersipora subatra TaxID=2589382 RepID=UPI00355B0471
MLPCMIGTIIITISHSSSVFCRTSDGERNITAEMIERERAEKRFSNTIFSRSTGNEFIDNSNASSAAQTDAAILRSIVDQTGINVTTSFDANGNPVDPEVMQVSAELRTSCEYDQANSLPCSSGYREPTARCTNRQEGRKTWGMSGTPYTRILPAAYQDGVSERRTLEHVSRQPLASPRTISTTVTTTELILDFEGFNAEIMQWGQFTAHEFTHLSEVEQETECCPDHIFASRNGTAVQPTEEDLEAIRQELKETKKDVCMQVETKNDTHYGGYLCMTQRRSSPAPLHDCSLGPRQQMNSITHVFDASAIYGSSQEELDSLRDSTGGKMKTQTVNGTVLPPPDNSRCPVARKAANKCPFLGGDTRINTTPNLVSTHTAFLVKHNQIAERLSSINPHWDHERLFQSSTHYYEYLPLIIGNETISKYELNNYTGFDHEVNPSSLNELAHAAFRFGHSTVGGRFSVLKDDGSEDFLDLTQNFNNPDLLYDGGYQQCLKGLQKDVPWLVDRNYPVAMRDTLFAVKKDIVSLNINRGRDHGFPPYVAYRRHYGLSIPRTFEDLKDTHPEEVVEALRKVYTTVTDVELYIGGITEKPLTGASVGELFANIIGDGFARIRNGDRLFFESPESGLTQAQIDSIKGYKYNKFLCDIGGMANISSNAFIIAGRKGATTVECDSLPELDLELWRENTQSPPQCSWRVTNEGPCCFGSQTLTRTCEGDVGCLCEGSDTIEEPCTCVTPDCVKSLWRRCLSKLRERW